MQVCDRCLSKDFKKVRVGFDEVKLKLRRILSVDFDICDKCTTDLLKTFGRFKKQFLKEGDSE